MFSFTSIVTVALSAVSVVNGLVIPRDGAPSTYNEGYLEVHISSSNLFLTCLIYPTAI